jgi:hypothetical protein
MKQIEKRISMARIDLAPKAQIDGIGGRGRARN